MIHERRNELVVLLDTVALPAHLYGVVVVSLDRDAPEAEVGVLLYVGAKEGFETSLSVVNVVYAFDLVVCYKSAAVAVCVKFDAFEGDLLRFHFRLLFSCYL
nr:MAG TPA: hypothetical protein [Caudoviricetes sp.]